MSGYRLIRLYGGFGKDEWPLERARSTVIGRPDRDRGNPDIDLSPDQNVSRRHARVWFENDAWWIEDLNSKHGTRLGTRHIRGGQRARLEPGVEARLGRTGVALFPPHWHQLRHHDLAVEIGVTSAVNYGLVHSGARIISRLTVRNRSQTASSPGRLTFSIAGVARAEANVPQLDPGGSRTLDLPKFDFDLPSLQGIIERTDLSLSVALDGERLASIPCWVLAHNEWSRAPEHRMTLAAFVLPNHPLVAQLGAEAAAGLPPGTPSGTVLEHVYHHLSTAWHIEYRYEAPHYETNTQKIRLADQVLADAPARRGHGTCLDLAVLMAGCLESLHVQPLVALIDMGQSCHALVGCWQQTAPRLEPVLASRERLLRDALWVDPNGCTRDSRQRKEFSEAQAAATSELHRCQLVCAVDVSAARSDGITPLPFGGEPQLSPAVALAIEAAQTAAARAHAQLAMVPLLIGLISINEGLSRRVLKGAGDADTLAKRLTCSLQRMDRPSPASQHYLEALAAARARAKAERSPVVLEGHVLGALLDVESTALDRALHWLGTDRAALQSALRELRDSANQHDPDASVFIGPPAVLPQSRSVAPRRPRP